MVGAKMKRVSAALMSCLLLLPGVGMADTPSPKQIFDGGYVNNSVPRDSVQPSIVRSGSNHKTIGTTESDVTLEEEKAATTQENGEFVSLGEEPKPEEEKKELEKNIPIESLALLVNGDNPQKSLSSIRNFTSTVVEYDLNPEAIYTMGIPNFSGKNRPPEFDKILIRGGTIGSNRKIGERYGITRVPAWIARTEEGDVILEGFSDINEFINTKGELRLHKVAQLASKYATQVAEELYAEGLKKEALKEQ